ncbi:MAG: hypothetical protein LBS49_09125 [Candidatus Accumulibacter sp.]|nr:hypothetical protein [Accumulibacter sp.]
MSKAARLDVGWRIRTILARRVLRQVLENSAVDFFQARGVELAFHRIAPQLRDSSKGIRAFPRLCLLPSIHVVP